MFRLDRKSHRYLIEPISGMKHIKQALMKRFLGFTDKLSSSRKGVLRNAYNMFKTDCRSTTGSNIRNIMLECNADPSTPMHTEVKKLQFHPALPEDEWRIGFINDLIAIRDGRDTDVEITRDELDIILEYLCTTWRIWILNHFRFEIHDQFGSKVLYARPAYTRLRCRDTVNTGFIEFDTWLDD